MSFVHLHVHSEYSLLDGFSNIKKLVERAKQMDMPALALTDHGTMFGVIDFFNQATNAGIKPIIGIEAYLAPRGMKSRDPQFDKKATHLLLLAENQKGYQNLLKLASAAQLDGFYYYPRVDHELVAAHSEGIICTSGCMSAEVPRLIADGNVNAAQKQLDWYFDVFNKNNFFLELQQHDIPELDSINRNLIQLGRRYDANFVATNDVHYIEPEDARSQDIMLAIQTGTLLSDPGRMRMTDGSYYLRNPEEMASLFKDVPEALSNTLTIAERCNVDLSFKGYHLPNFDVPEGFTPDSYLRTLCEEGLKNRYGSRADDPILLQRLDFELNVIHQMGFDPYFLIVWDLCRYATSRDIWYNARGSAAGSIVAYSLNITLVDPIEHGLIFERFLNPGRISMPDIDLDFRDDRRAEMMEYTARKYGDDKVAQIITFGTLGARAAIRDVGRVMDIPLSEVDRVAKLVPNIPGKPISIHQALEEVPDFKKAYSSTSYMKDLIDTASDVEGVVRNAGTHAAGVIITDQPIIDYIPLHRPTGNTAGESPIKTVTQFEMNILDSLGLLKVDFLGLSTLTIMAKACDLIEKRHGIKFTLDNIPTDDPPTFELLGRGDTAGVFQVEGSGMRRWLMEMKPTELKNVVAMVALFRPGPMDFIPGYIRRMHGEEEVQYLHPWLEEIFRETYGYPVYQEQLMFAAMKLAGYTAPEADDLRKAIAKKMPEKLIKHRQKFIDGASKQEIDKDTAAKIFEEWEEFARYGFNKSHAVDYAVIAVQTAFLKLHYSVEYMTALLSVSKNDTAKVAIYVADARKMGIGVSPPDVNASDWDFAIEDCGDGSSVIRFGLGGVKNVGQAAVETILSARIDGQFASIDDFARRVDLRQVGRRSLEFLIKVGALDKFGQRTSLLESIDRIIASSASHFRAAESGQMSLFGTATGVMEKISLSPVNNGINRREILDWEKELIGLYVSDHPLNSIISELEDVVTHFSGQLGEATHLEPVRVAGIVTKIRSHITKSGQPMAFVSMEDLQGSIELVIFPRAWERYSELAQVDRIILVDGKVDAAGGDPKILVDNITTEFTRTIAAASLNKEKSNLQKSPDVHLAKSISTNSYPIGNTYSLEPENITLENNPIPQVPEEPPDWFELQTSKTEKVLPGFPDDQSHEVSLSEPELKDVEAGTYSVKFENLELRDSLKSPVTISGFEMDNLLSEDPITSSQPEHTGFTIQPAVVPAPTLIFENQNLPPIIVPPQRKPSAENQHFASFLVPPHQNIEDTGEVRMLTVILRASGDKTRDVLRLRRIHGIMMTYPGIDRFSIQVFERGRSFLLEFPNSSTQVCSELIERLNGMLGPENILIESITFQ